MREMKDSGVEWIGEIPKDWSCMRLKFAFGNSNVGESVDKELYSSDENGYIFYTAGANPVKTSYTEFPMWKYTTDNDILLARNGTPYIYLPSKDAVYSDHIIRINIKDGYCRRFLRYCLQRSIESIIVDSVSIATWSISLWKEQKLPLPYYHEQKYLADYLDIKCSKIDEIIEKQQVIIEKLKEYKLSIITEAVTSGINPDVEMKDSGSVWFGSIPINWEMKRLKYVFHIQKDIAGEEGHTVLSITQKGIIPKDFSNNEGQFANSYANYQLVHKGDFAMNHMDLLTGWVDISKYEGVTSPDYRVFVLNDKNGMCPEYYLYMMQMCYSARIFYGLGQGVSGMGRWRLQADKFLNFHIPIPPYDEQKIIADYITDKVNHIEVEIDKRNKLVEKYQEYKKSLIYEVVTGKKEV